MYFCLRSPSAVPSGVAVNCSAGGYSAELVLPLKMVDGKIETGFNMAIKIDKAGRIVVPKPLRERLGFRPDTELEAIERPEGVLLKRVEQRPSMTKMDGLWLHQASPNPEQAGTGCLRTCARSGLSLL
jgi:AbrB family looped-hinge helix DNA binding protein